MPGESIHTLEATYSPYPTDFSESEIAMIHNDEIELRASLGRDLDTQDYYKMLDGAFQVAEGTRGAQIYVGHIEKPQIPGAPQQEFETEEPLRGGQYPAHFTAEDISKVRRGEIGLLANGFRLQEQDYDKLLRSANREGTYQPGAEIFVGDIRQPWNDAKPESQNRETRLGRVARKIGRKCLAVKSLFLVD